jgi:hypothetical protein
MVGCDPETDTLKATLPDQGRPQEDDEAASRVVLDKRLRMHLDQAGRPARLRRSRRASDGRNRPAPLHHDGKAARSRGAWAPDLLADASDVGNCAPPLGPGQTRCESGSRCGEHGRATDVTLDATVVWRLPRHGVCSLRVAQRCSRPPRRPQRPAGLQLAVGSQR